MGSVLWTCGLEISAVFAGVFAASVGAADFAWRLLDATCEEN